MAQQTARAAVIVVIVWVSAWSSNSVVVAGGQLATADAKTWMGDWTLTVEGRRGPQEQTLTIKDVGGKVAATLAGGRGGPVEISDVSKNGNDLVLKFKRNFQGNEVEVKLTLAMQSDGSLKVTQDQGGNATTGTGKKKS
jgi:hypothetical protein